MDYEKKYKEALERARDYKNNIVHKELTVGESIMDYIFPELKESEDERIRKEIIDVIQHTFSETSRGKKKWIAWLEKQGGKPQGKSIIEAWKDMRLEVYQQASGNRHEPNYSDDSTKMFSLNDIDEIIEKINEHDNQNCVTDKVEPKFKVGDWVVFDGETLHITNVTENGYSTEDGVIPFRCEKETKLWTIADAKGGDVLASELSDSIILFKGIEDNNIQFYCDYDFSEIDVPGDRFSVNNSGQHYGNIEESEDFHPATKEQRDLLFAKMKEAGYEWSEETHELKEIKQKPAEWNEDSNSIISDLLDYFDEDKCLKHEVNDIVEWLKTIKPQQKGCGENEIKMLDNLITYLDGRKDLLEEIKSTYIDWLKSLKDRVQPQPKQEWSEEEQVSEEFINALGTMLNDGLPDRYLVSEERIKKSAELLFSIARKQLKNEMQEWSEEDEKCIRLSTDIIDSALRAGFCVQLDRDICVDWFNSRRTQKQWKPTEEQINALSVAVKHGQTDDPDALKKLLEQLKKL